MDYTGLVTDVEIADAQGWLERILSALTRRKAPGDPGLAGKWRDRGGQAVSFACACEPSGAFLHTWDLEQYSAPAGDRVVAHHVVRTDRATGLQLAVDLKAYRDFPVVEWVAAVRNTGKSNSPVISEFVGLDLFVGTGGSACLHHYTGDYCAPDGYEPHCKRMEPGRDLHFAPEGGRPTNKAWPYYNLEELAEARGTIIVIGWPGQWACRFRCNVGSVHVTAGQELTRFSLRPGEQARTPLSVLMPYRGDRVRSQNLWRRWMMAHNMPRPGGSLPPPIMPGNSSLWFNEMTRATAGDQVRFIDRYVEEGVGIDYWWMDAGWYPCEGQWPKTGTWEPDPVRFPGGLRVVSDHARARGIRTLVWFEPERVAPGTWLYENRPAWLLGEEGKQKLLDLGNEQARRWLTDHVDRLLAEQGIDLYRQDFNIDPLGFWRANDAADRQGITENRYVMGYLAYWDELLRRRPGLLIDSCASGGRRNDLETMRRSVPLHKTDYNYSDLPVKQAFHHTLSSWIPYYGAPVLPVDSVDACAFRSAFAPCLMLGFDMRRADLDYPLMARLAAEWRHIAPCFYGDYYPLTPYSRDGGRWIAWQFDRPDLGRGVVQAFRRAESPCESARFRLRGLDPQACYKLTDADTGPATESTGRDLMDHGLLVAVQDRPAAVVIEYERTGNK